MKFKIKKLLKILSIFVLVASWLLAGWPPIWQNPRIPPEIQEAQAAFPAILSRTVTLFTTETTSAVVNMPSTINSGDLLLAIGTLDGSAAVTDPSGSTWTRVHYTSRSTYLSSGLWYRVAGASEPSTYTWTTGSEQSAWHVIRIQAGTYDVARIQASVQADTWDPPSLTASWGSADNLWIAHGGQSNTANFTAGPADYTLSPGYLASEGTKSTAGASVATAFRELATATEDPGFFGPNSGNTPISFTYVIGPTSNVPPSLTVSQPDGVGDTVTEGDSYNITYTLTDPDSVATVDFYYDTDDSGLDGTAISGCQDQAEGTDTTCSWNTTGMAGGSYYVYGIATDGVNPDVSDYSPGQITIRATSGRITSTKIDYDWFTGASAWNEAFWTEDETYGTVKVQVYYTVTTTCDTLVPDDGTGFGGGCAAANNSTGFTTSPIDISCLNTTTYNEICLKATLTASGGSAELDDWGVSVPESSLLLFGSAPFLLGLIYKFRRKRGLL